jgi:hypothetical protein
VGKQQNLIVHWGKGFLILYMQNSGSRRYRTAFSLMEERSKFFKFISEFLMELRNKRE